MKAVTLKAIKGACSRTKNRLREHGNVFTQTRGPQTCLFDNDNRMWIFVTAPDGWDGWLPVDELDIS